jgi:hypothetical protein
MGGSHGEGHEHAFKKETAPTCVVVLSFGLRLAGLSPQPHTMPRSLSKTGLEMEGADESCRLEPPPPRGEEHRHKRMAPPTTTGTTTDTEA